MAKSKKSATGPKRQRRPRRIRRWLTALVLMASIIAGLPTAIVVAVGMLPTVVSFIVDMTPGRYACRCVAGFNVAGVAPFVAKLWGGYNDVGAALSIVGDTLAWLAFYGSAGFGWMLFLSLPGVVATSRTLNARRLVNKLRARQEELAREWGLAVAAPAKLEESTPKSGPTEDEEVFENDRVADAGSA